MKIDEVISKYVPSRRQKELLMLFSLAWMLDAAGVMLMTFTLGSITKEWNLTAVQASSIASSTFMGMLVGALTSGFVADKLGRKLAMNMYLAFTVIFTVLNGTAQTPLLFGVLRFLSGVGYGGLMPSVNTYLSESIAIKVRGRYLVLLEASWAIGSILIGWYAVTLGTRFGWRSVYYVLAAGALLFIPFLLLPESPKFAYIKRGKDGLEKVLRVKVKEDIEPVEKRSVPVAALLEKAYIKRTVMVWVSWFVVSFVYYGLFIWLPKFFASTGISEARSLWYSFFMMLAQLPGYLSAAYFIEKIGRKASLAIYFFGTAAAALGFSLVNETASLVTMGLITSFFCLGVWGLVYAYTPELFPTAFRGTANGSAGVMARIAGITAPYFTAVFAGKENIFAALVWFALFATVAAIFVLMWGVETKGEATG
ncbi:MAG: transporter, putative metabolite:H+ symporter [Thermotogota bacterium]|nr:transporter, putative metabolite:H+ symporter [Thermotogota bacterium]